MFSGSFKYTKSVGNMKILESKSLYIYWVYNYVITFENKLPGI